MDFRRRHIFLARTYTSVPKRTLRKHLRACGAVVVRHATRDRYGRLKIPIDTVVLGDGLEGHESQLVPGVSGDAHYWNEAQVVRALGINDTPNERLTRLRGLMASALTPDRWYRVCCCLEIWPEEHGLDMAIDYVAGHAAELADQLRTGLPRWFVRAASSTDEPRLRVVRNVDLREVRPTAGQIKRLLSSPHLDQVTRLDLTRGQLSDEVCATLARDPRFERLEHLVLDACTISVRGVEQLLSAKTFGNLQTLSLRSVRGAPNDLGRLRDRFQRSAEVIVGPWYPRQW